MLELKYPDTLLEICRKKYEAGGIETCWGEPTSSAPYNSLLVRFTEVGARDASIVFELCFLPMKEVAEQGIYILQTFAAVMEKIPKAFHIELLKTVAGINIQLPLGAFGLFEDSGLLYFKYNCMIKKSADEDAAADLIDRQSGMLLHQQYVFADMLLDVAEGRKSAADALKTAPMPIP